jgi:arylsulfatase A-like enzyme
MAGSTSGALIAHLDMPATLATLVGASIPAGQCIDSQNILPALLGESAVGRAEFVAHVGGTQGPFAVRDRDWKYISPGAGAKGKTAPAPQLYDLKADTAEERNLAESQPEKLSEMRALLAKIRQVE